MYTTGILKEILTVHTYTRPNLRDGEMLLYLGQGLLSDLFDSDKDITDTTEIQLYYPERWLNILEQRALFDIIMDRCPNIRKIMITTHCVYIMQCTPNGCLFICDKASDYPECKYEPGVRYSPPIQEHTGLERIKMFFS